MFFDWSTLKKLIWLRAAGVIGAVWKTITNVAVASFTAVAAPVRALVVDINPAQDLHGYDSPWPAGGGKNKLLLLSLAALKSNNSGGTWSGNTYTLNGITFECVFDSDTERLTTVNVSGTASARAFFVMQRTDASRYAGMKLNGAPIGGAGKRELVIQLASSPWTGWAYAGDGVDATIDASATGTSLFMIVVSSGASFNGTFYPMIRDASITDATFAPYSNICPISGWTGAKVWVEPTHDTTANPTVTIDLDGTRYGGTLNVTTGVLTVTDGNIASYNGETLPGAWISSMDVYAAGTTPTTGAQVVYQLATPQVIQLTPTEVTTLLGQNNVWADTGNINTITYRES